jgi:hypothetical protein
LLQDIMGTAWQGKQLLLGHTNQACSVCSKILAPVHASSSLEESDNEGGAETVIIQWNP